MNFQVKMYNSNKFIYTVIIKEMRQKKKETSEYCLKKIIELC